MSKDKSSLRLRLWHCQRSNGPRSLVHNLSKVLISSIKNTIGLPGRTTCIGFKYGNQVAPHALDANLATGWHHLYWNIAQYCQYCDCQLKFENYRELSGYVRGGLTLHIALHCEFHSARRLCRQSKQRKCTQWVSFYDIERIDLHNISLFSFLKLDNQWHENTTVCGNVKGLLILSYYKAFLLKGVLI